MKFLGKPAKLSGGEIKQEFNAMKQRRSAKSNTKHPNGSWDPKPKRLENGYDHVHLAGVIDGRYTSCDSSFRKMCKCYGCSHYEQVPGINAQIVERRKGGIHFSASVKSGAHSPSRSSARPQPAMADVTRRDPFSILTGAVTLSALLESLSR